MQDRAYTADELKELFLDHQGREWVAEFLPRINRWLERGDGVAVFENQDLGHPELGDLRPVSFGSGAAFLEGIEDPARLPRVLPDTRTLINWRYCLAGWYRGEPLELLGEADSELIDYLTEQENDRDERSD